MVWKSIHVQQKISPWQDRNRVLHIDPSDPTHTLELELGETILVFYILVMFHIYECTDLSGEVLNVCGHKKLYRALVVKRYLDSNYKYCLLAILDFILGI